MIDQILDRENYVIAKKLLDVAHTRHQTLASNLANVETPGFKRSDLAVGFESKLRELAKVDNVHGIREMDVSVVQDAQSPSVRPDGNNVQMDRELLEMSRNATQYDFLTFYAANSLKRIQTAITGQVS